jgi:hypothetical protein
MKLPTPSRRRHALRIVAVVFAGLVLWFAVKTWSVVRAPVVPRFRP